MKNKHTNIEKSFRTGTIVAFILIIALFTSVLTKSKNSGFIVGFSLIIAGILGIIGSIQGIKGLKEKKTLKMAFALLINFGIVLLIVAIVVLNILDIVKALN